MARIQSDFLVPTIVSRTIEDRVNRFKRAFNVHVNLILGSLAKGLHRTLTPSLPGNNLTSRNPAP